MYIKLNSVFSDTEDDTNRGVLFTNGTGTGKTYTGLGIMKRFVRQGKTNIAVVVPTDKKAQDWIEDGKNIHLDIAQLEGLKDSGKDIIVTTLLLISDRMKLYMNVISTFSYLMNLINFVKMRKVMTLML